MYNLEMERRIYQEFGVDIDAFFYDEFGCNYIDDDNNIVSLYDELDKDLEAYIQSHTHFLTLDNQDNIDRFIDRYLGKRQSFKQYQQEYDSVTEGGYGFFDKTFSTHDDIGFFNLIHNSGVSGFLYEDDFDGCLYYMRNKIPSFDNQHDIDEYIKACMLKLSTQNNEQ